MPWCGPCGSAPRIARRSRVYSANSATASLMALAMLAWQNALDSRTRRREAQVISAELMLDRGLTLCEEDDVAGGLVWLSRSLRALPGDAPELENVIRVSLSAWMERLARI